MERKDKFPLVSVGIPIVKSNFLEKCIKCVLHQSYANIEIIIVNNARDQHEGDKIEAIISGLKDGKIRYIRNKTQLPIIENWNKTLFLSNGDFFAILCDDDYWEPEFIETMVRLTVKFPEIDIFHCRCLIINETDDPINISPICPEFEDATDFIYHRIKGFRLQFLSDFFVRASALKQINGFFPGPDGWGSDDLTWFRLSMAGGIAYSSKTLFHYRETPVSVTNTMKSRNKIFATDIYFTCVKDILDTLSKSDRYKPVIIHLMLKQLDELRKKRLLNHKAEYLRKKYMLNPFFLKIAMNFLRIKYKIVKHY